MLSGGGGFAETFNQETAPAVSGSRGMLPSPSPLRTVRASFPAHGSRSDKTP